MVAGSLSLWDPTCAHAKFPFGLAVPAALYNAVFKIQGWRCVSWSARDEKRSLLYAVAWILVRKPIIVVCNEVLCLYAFSGKYDTFHYSHKHTQLFSRLYC